MSEKAEQNVFSYEDLLHKKKKKFSYNPFLEVINEFNSMEAFSFLTKVPICLRYNYINKI